MMEDYDYEPTATGKKGFDSPMTRNKDKKPEGEHHGRKSAFGRKSHRHKKRTSHRK